MEKNFKKYVKYYDLLYSDKDYNKEASYVCETLKILGFESGKILEFGSGTGKHANIITKSDYTVHGIERSAEMVSEALITDKFTCQIGDICKIRIQEQFDVIISLFHVVSYITDNNSLISLFESARAHLKKGGIFLFDVWYTPAVYYLKPQVKVKRVFNEEIEVLRIAEPEVLSINNMVNVIFTLFVTDKKFNTTECITEVHEMRHFSLPELNLLAGLHGFECVLSEEFLTKDIPSENTWGVCFAFKKL